MYPKLYYFQLGNCTRCLDLLCRCCQVPSVLVQGAVGGWLVADFGHCSDGAHTHTHKDRVELRTKSTATSQTRCPSQRYIHNQCQELVLADWGGCVSTPLCADTGCLVCLHLSALSTIFLIFWCLDPGQDGKCLMQQRQSFAALAAVFL